MQRRPTAGDFRDFGVSFTATVAGRYTRRGGLRLSVRGGPLLVLKRGPLYLACNAAPQQDPDLSGPLTVRKGLHGSQRSTRLQSKLGRVRHCKGGKMGGGGGGVESARGGVE